MKIAKNISRKFYRQLIVGFLACCLAFNASVPVVLATPNGADVVAGSAAVNQAANTTTVTMDSARAVINWDSLNTSQNEVLEFLKAGGNFAVLNRVIQGGATDFRGSLFGNQGHIIIVNPSGIVFGPTALVQAYKFTASGLNITNSDFMNGIYKFAGGNGAVSNYGDITAQQVNLIGKKIFNAGTITSPNGYVIMAAGDKVFLGNEGSDVVVEVESVSVPDPTDPASDGAGDVINEGTIEAAGGKIVLAAGDTFSRAIEGLDSLTVAVESGTGRVGQFGTLSVDAVDGDGGSINISAADTIALSSDSLTTANAGTNGDGGEVIVYSPDTALFWDGARIEAKGGSESGDGGFVEVSGKEYLELLGSVDTSAPMGEVGTFLIDPYAIAITNNSRSGSWSGSNPDVWTSVSRVANESRLNVSELLSHLNSANVVVQTGGDSWFIVDLDDFIRVDTPINYSGSLGNLTLQAHDNIYINQPITAGTHNLTLTANMGGDGGNVNVDAAINSTTGNISASGVNFSSNGSGSITTTGGNVGLNMSGAVTINAAVTTNGGNFTSAGTTFDNTGGIIDTSGSGGDITLNHTDTVTLGAQLEPGDGTISGTAPAVEVVSSAASIQDAIDVAASGATIDVSAGTYNEQVTIDKDNLTIQSTTGAATTIITPTDTSAGGIFIQGSGNTFDGFTVRDFTDTGYESKIVRIHNNADDNIIINNIIQGNLNQGGVVNQTDYGILCYGSGNLIQDNEIYDIGYMGIDVVGPPHSGASNTTISNNNVHDIGIYAIGIDRSPGNIITGNTISNLVGGTLWGDYYDPADWCWGIIVWGETADGTQITDQVVSGLPNGIVLSSAHNSLIEQCDISNNTGIGLKVVESGWAGGIPTGNQIINNNINNNDVGVKISGNIGAGNVFNENSIADNTTMGMNNTSGTEVDATAGWWGDATGPYHYSTNTGGLGNEVSDDVDFSPWLGDGTDDEPGTLGFQPVAQTTWWTNDSIQDAIDLASTTAPYTRINVVAGTYDEAVNVNKQLEGIYFIGDGTVGSEIGQTLTLSDDVVANTGVGIHTETGDLTLNSVADTGTHNLELDISGGALYLNGNVAVGNDLILGGDTVVAAGITLDVGQDLTLGSGQTLDGLGDLTLEADRHITLGGAADVVGALIIDAGGEVDVQALTAGSIDIYSSDTTTNLHDDVTSTGGSIQLHNNTWAADGIIIDADGDVIVGEYLDPGYTETTLTGEGSLTVEAGSDIILGGDVDASVDLPGDLILTAGNDIYAYGFLTAHDGSIVITSGLTTTYLYKDVTASENVTLHNSTVLCGEDGGPFDQRIDALNGTLWADGTVTKTTVGDLTLAGDVLVDLDGIDGTDGYSVYVTNGGLTIENPVDAEGHLTASGDIHLQGAANLAGDVISTGSGITFDDDVIADGTGDQTFDAGTGELIAENGVDIDKTTEGSLTLAADAGIELGGNVTGSGMTDNDSLILENEVIADGTGDAGDQEFDADSGALWAQAAITKTSEGDLTLAGDEGINLDGTVDVDAGNLYIENDFTATGDLIASDDVIFDGSPVNGELDGTGDQRIEAEDGTLWANGTLTKTGDGDLYLAGELGIDLDGTVDVDAGSLYIEDNFSAAGDLLASDDVTFNGSPVNGELDGTGDQRIDAEGGTLWANGTLTKTTEGDLYLAGELGIDLDGAVTVLNGILFIEDDFSAAGDLHGSDGISGPTANGELNGAGDQSIDAEDGTLWVNGIIKTSEGDLHLIGNGGIDIDGTVAVQDGSLFIEDDFTAAGDLTASDDVTFDGSPVNGELDGAGDQRIDAEGGTLWANGTLTKTTEGDLTLAGEQGIDLDDDVDVQDGSLFIEDDTVVAAAKTLSASEDITVGTGDPLSSTALTGEGDLTVDAGQNIMLGGPVETAGDLYLDAGIDVFAYSTLTAGGDIDIYSAFEEYYDTTYLYDDVTSLTGNVHLHSDTYAADGVKLDAAVDVILGDEIEEGEYTSPFLAGEGELIIEADEDVILGGDVTASGDTSGDLIITAGEDVYAYGELVNYDGDIEIYSSDRTTHLYDDVLSYWGNIYLHNNTWAADDVWIMAGLDVMVGDELPAYGYTDTTLTGDGFLLVAAGDDITLCGNIEAASELVLLADYYDETLWPVGDGDDGHGDVWAMGSVKTTEVWDEYSGIYIEGVSIDIEGPVDSDGYLEMYADKSIHLYDSVTSGDYMGLYAGGPATIEITGDVESGGSMTMISDGDIEITGDVQSGDSMLLASIDGDIEIDGDVESDAGMTINTSGSGSGDIEITGDIKSDDDMIIDTSGSDDGDVDIEGDIESDGTLTIDTSDSGSGDVDIDGDVQSDDDMTITTSGSGSGDVDVAGDITSDGTMTIDTSDSGSGDVDIDGDVESDDDMTMDTTGSDSGDIDVAGSVTSDGFMTIDTRDTSGPGSGDVDIDGDVESDDDMTITSAGGIHLEGSLTSSDGSISLNSGGMFTIEIAGDVYADDDLDMYSSGGGIHLDGSLTADDGYIYLVSNNGDIDIVGPVTSEDGIDMLADEGIYLGSSVTSHDGYIYMFSGSITTIDIAGDVYSGGYLNMLSDGDIDIGGDVESDDEMYLNSAGDIVIGGSVTSGESMMGPSMAMEADGIEIGGSVTAAGDMYLTSYVGDIDIADDVEADTYINMNSAGSIHLGGSLTSNFGSIDLNFWGVGPTIEVAGDVYSAGYVNMYSASGGIHLGGSVTADDGYIYLDSDDGDIDVAGPVDSGLGIEMHSSDDIILRDSVDAGDYIELVAYSDVIAYGPMTAVDDIDIYSSDNTTELYDDVTSTDGSIYLHNNTWAADGVTIDAYENVMVGDYLDPGYTDTTLTGAGDLTVIADDEITLTGAVEAAGDLRLYADNNYGGYGDMWAMSSITTTSSGDMYVEGASIFIDGLVDSAGLIDMYAGEDITIFGSVTSGDYIYLWSDDSDSIHIYNSVDSGDSIYMYAFGGIDIDGSVTSVSDMELITDNGGIDIGGLADSGSGMYMSADNGIVLGSGAEADGDITLDALGDVEVHGDLYSYGGSIDIYSAPVTIYLYGDTIAFEDVTLNDNTVLNGGDQRIEAQTGTLWANGTITKNNVGDLYLAGETAIDLDGTVDIDDGSLFIEDDFTAAGDLLASDDVTFNGSPVNGEMDGVGDQRIDAETGTLWANGTLTKTTVGNLILGGGTAIDLDGTVDVQAGSLIIEDDFSAAGDLLASGGLDGSTVSWTLDGQGDQRIDAEDGTLLSNGITKTEEGDLYLAGDAGIDLGGTVDVEDGSLFIEDDFTAAGDLLASDDVTFNGSPVNGELDGTGNQRIEAEDGTLWANGTLTKTTEGDLYLAGDTAIDLDGTVNVKDGSLFIEDDFTAEGDLLASDDITFNGSPVNGQLDGIGDQRIDAEAGTLWANGTLTKITAGDLYLAGDTAIDLDGTVDVEDGSLFIEDDFSAAADLIAGSDVIFDFYDSPVNGQFDGTDDQRIDAETGTLWANGTLTKTTEGDLTLAGDDEIDLDDNIDVQDGSLVIEDDVVVAADKTLSASEDVTIGTGEPVSSTTLTGEGNLTVNAGSNITIGGAVETLAAGNLGMYAGGGIYTYDSVTSGGGMFLNSDGDDTIEIAGDVESFLDVFMYSAGSIHLGGSLTALDGSIDLQSGSNPENETIEIAGDVHSAGPVDMYSSGGGIHIGGSLTSDYSYIYLDSDYGDITIAGPVAAELWIDMFADDGIHLGDSITANDGYIYLNSGGVRTIEIAGDVYSYYDIDMYSSGGGIHLGGSVTADDGYIFLGSGAGDITIAGPVTSYSDTDMYADYGIYLRDSVTSYNGYINLNSGGGKTIEITGPVYSASYVSMYSSGGGIHLGGSVTSGDYIDLFSYDGDITIAGPVFSGSYMSMQAGYDVTIGDYPVQSLRSMYMYSHYGDIIIDGPVSSGMPMDVEPSMSMYAAGSIHLGDSVASYGDMILNSGGIATIEITGPVYSYGNMTMSSASGGIHLYNAVSSAGYIDLDSYFGDIYIAGPVNSDLPVNMDAAYGIDLDSELTSGSSIELLSYVPLFNIDITGPVSSESYITMNSAGGIYLGDSISSLYSYITLNSGGPATIDVIGPVYSSDYLAMYCDGGGIHLHNFVTSGGSMSLTSYFGDIDIVGPVHSGSTMNMYADYAITIGDYLVDSVGSMHLQSYEGDIDIDGPVVSGSYVELWAADGIYVDDYITSGTYMDLRSYGVDTIDITGDVTSGTEMTMYSAGSIYLGAYVTSLDGSINLTSTAEDTIDITGPVSSSGYLNMYSDGDIRLHNSVNAAYGMYLQSYDGAIDIVGPVNTDPAGLYTSSMYAKYDITIADHLVYAGGLMHLESYEGNIDIAGPVVSGLGMELWAADGLYIDDYITSGTYMDLQSFGLDTIDISGPVQSGTAMSMYSTGSIYLRDSVTAITGPMSLTSDGLAIDVTGPVYSGGGMDMESAGSIYLRDSVTSLGSMTLDADYGVVDVVGPVYSASDMTIRSDYGGIMLHDSVTSVGPMSMDADDSDIVITGPVESTASSISMYAEEGIYVDDDMTAGTSIYLRSDGIDTIDIAGAVYAGTNINMVTAGSIHLGDSVTAQTGSIYMDSGYVDTIEIAGPVYAYTFVELYSAGDIRLHGSVTSDTDSMYIYSLGGNIYLYRIADSGGSMTLEAIEVEEDIDYFVGGNVYAYGPLIAVDDIHIISAEHPDDTAFLYDDVTSTDGSIRLYENTWAADGVTINADEDVIVGGYVVSDYTGTTLTGEGALTVGAGHDIIFGGDVDASVDLPGDLTLTAGNDIYAYGYLTSHNGSIDITSGLTTTYLYKDVTAYEDISIHGATVLCGVDTGPFDQRVDALNGTLWFDGTVTKTTEGDLYLAGDQGIDLDDDVEVQDGSLFLEDDTVVAADKTLKASEDITVGIEGPPETYTPTSLTGEGNLTVDAGGDITVGGAVETLATGYLDMDAGGGIYLHDSVTSGGYMDLYSAGSSTIEILGPVYSGGNMDMVADGGGIYLGDSVTSDGHIDLRTNNDSGIEIEGPVLAADYVKMDAYYGITVHDSVDSVSEEVWMYDNEGGSINVEGHIDAGTYVYLKSDNGGDVYVTGYVTARDLISGWIEIYTEDGDIEIIGPVQSATTTYMYADGGSIHLHDSVTTGEYLILESINNTGTIEVGGPIDSGTYIYMLSDGGGILLHDSVTSGGWMDLDSYNGSIEVDGPVYSGDEMWLYADGGGIYLHDSVESVGYMNLQSYDYDTIEIDGPVYSGGDMDMYAYGGGIYIHDSVESASYMNLQSYNNVRTIEIDGPVESGTTMYMYSDNGGILLHDSVTSGNWMDLDSYNGSIEVDGPVDSGYWIEMYSDAGNIHLKSSIDSAYYMTLNSVGGDIQIDGPAYSGDTMWLQAVEVEVEPDVFVGGDVIANSTLTANSNINIYSADDTTYLYDDVASITANINLHNNTWAADGVTIDAAASVMVGEDLDPATLTGAGDLTVIAEDNITLTGEVEAAGDLRLYADNNYGSYGNMWAKSSVKTTNGGDMYVEGSSIWMDGFVDSAGLMYMNAGYGNISLGSPMSTDDYVQSGTTMDMYAAQEIYIYGPVTSGDYMNLNSYDSDSIHIHGFVDSGDYIYMYAYGGIYLYSGAEADTDIALDATGDVEVHGDLYAYDGSIDIWSSDTTTYLYGDTIADEDVTLHNNTVLCGQNCEALDQVIVAENGTLTAYGYVQKQTPGDMLLWGGSDGLSVDLLYEGGSAIASSCFGNLWILGEGDVQIADGAYVTSFGPYTVSGEWDEYECRMTGGVYIGSEAGKVYSRGGADDTLNLVIEGKSDHAEQLGVYDIYEHGWPYEGEEPIARHAILITSVEDLILGEDSELIARGTYYDNEVDDRDAIGFLDEITTIGNASRNDGDPFDSAIYLASQNNVELGGSVEVVPCDEELEPGTPSGATVVADAYDTVTFADSFTESLDEVDGEAHTFRLEVCSRITEWLDEAIVEGTLPYADNPDFMSDLLRDDYVLRGAGLGNPGIIDGRAWVLNESPAAPLPDLLAAQAEQAEFTEGGCPVLLDWLASELDIPEEEIQTFVSDAFAFATDIQPCVACERLKAAAEILEDPNGAGIAALVQVLSEFAATEAPPSEEQMALIAAALAEHTGDGTYYADAGLYIDALVEYVTILTIDMNWTLDDATALAMRKYGEPITNSGNPALVAYVEARLAAIGG